MWPTVFVSQSNFPKKYVIILFNSQFTTSAISSINLKQRNVTEFYITFVIQATRTLRRNELINKNKTKTYLILQN